MTDGVPGTVEGAAVSPPPETAHFSERWVVLLGAGASAEGGIPMSRGMTREMASDLADRQRALGGHDYIGAFRFVCGQLIAHQSSKGADPFTDTPDVEEVFSAIELLAQRRDLEIAPFVASWLPEVDAIERPSRRGRPHPVSDALKRWLDGQVGRAPSSNAVDDAIRALVRSEVGLAGDPVYQPLLERMIVALRRLAEASDPERFAYLDPLFDLAGRQRTLTIATLNYDRGIEVRAGHLGRAIDTGIGSWTLAGRIEWTSAPLRLLKLHGSVDWAWQDRGHVYNRLQRRDVVVTTGGSETQTPVVLFGQRGKLRAEGPFLDLLRAFAEALEQATHLAVVGYSFRDDHVNEYIGRWLTNDSTRRIVIADPNLPQPSPYYQPHPSFRDQLLGLAAPTVPPGQPTIEPQVRLLRKPASEALAEIFP